MTDEEDAAAIAAALLDVTGQTKPPVQLLPILAEMGVDYALDDEMPPRHDGVLFLINGEPHIRVRHAMTLTRRRFSAGHEIAHLIYDVLRDAAGADWYLHASNELYYELSSNRRANRFASELLMPEAWLRADWASRPNFDAQRDRYEVSRRALHIRLHELELCPCPLSYDRWTEPAEVYSLYA